MYLNDDVQVDNPTKCAFTYSSHVIFLCADGVSNAADAAGVDTVTGMETVTQVAGNDPEIQAAYREQVRLAVRENLTNNPDFNAERFPNTAKYFK
jgi:hypothetical protein